MSSRLFTGLFAATALLSVGCDNATGVSNRDAANVRLVNASPVAGNVSVAVNGTAQTGASDVAFLNAGSQCTRVNATNSQLTLQQTQGTVTLPTTTFAFDAGGRNTIIVAGTTAANLRVVTISDPLQPALAAGHARVRVVNARATTAMDTYVYPWSQQSFGTATTINTSTTPATAWIDVAADVAIAVRLTPVGQPNTITAILNWLPRSGEELTFVAVDPATTGGDIRWIVTTPCSAP